MSPAAPIGAVGIAPPLAEHTPTASRFYVSLFIENEPNGRAIPGTLRNDSATKRW